MQSPALAGDSPPLSPQALNALPARYVIELVGLRGEVSMKRFWLGFAFVPLTWAASADLRVPVVIELFTSEGCSSCPPADELLARLAKIQSVPNARIIALEEHVDYWNHLGWADPFSSPQFRARQTEYAQAFRTEDIYTPQMIVNGRVAFVSDSMNKAIAEIRRAAAPPLASVLLHPAPNRKNPELVDLDVRVAVLPDVKPPGKLDVLLAITEDNLSTNVPRGENAGRRLRHAAVVRSFGVIGSLDPRKHESLDLRPTLKFPSEWKRADLKAVVFLQERSTRQIVGAETWNLE